MSLPLRIFLRTALTIGLVWALVTYLPQYITVTGGLGGYVIIGVILMLLNLIVRPILSLLTLPLRLVTTLIAIILTNAVFLWILVQATDYVDPALATLQIHGGIAGWLVVSIAMGAANWLMKLLFK